VTQEADVSTILECLAKCGQPHHPLTRILARQDEKVVTVDGNPFGAEEIRNLILERDGAEARALASEQEASTARHDLANAQQSIQCLKDLADLKKSRREPQSQEAAL
jgi:hypothetical protein